jgi:hypothetical protein
MRIWEIPVPVNSPKNDDPSLCEPIRWKMTAALKPLNEIAGHTRQPNHKAL